MAVTKRSAAKPATDDGANKGSTTTTTEPKQVGGGTDASKDVAVQGEGRSTSITAPNEVKNDPGATGDKSIDESRVAAHQDALKARDGENAKSPYSDIPAAGSAGKNDDDESKGKLAIKPKPKADDEDDDGSSEPAPGEGSPEEHSDGVALGTSFTHGSADFTSDGIPVVDDQYAIDKVPDGQEFYAAFLHDPSKSDDHYGVVNSVGDLQSGKVSRRGIPASYWQGQYTKTPPRARRDAKSRKGYEIVG